MADPIREALERLVVRLAATYDPDGPVPAWADSYFAALAVLAAEPPAPADPPTLPEVNAAWLATYCEDENRYDLMAFVDIILARWGSQPPAPAPAADGEREELVDHLGRIAAQLSDAGWKRGGASVARAAALLRQPAPAPVPVSERPWEREGWCDAEGECWWRDRRDPAWWTTADPRMVYDGWLLPYWAIPQPSQGGGVAE